MSEHRTCIDIIPSIIAKNQEDMVERINKVKDHVNIIQLDVMDGIFVPNRSIDFDFHLPDTKCSFEAHLMVDDPLVWIKKHGEKVDTILVHVESCEEPKKVIGVIKSLDKKAGLVLKPETPLGKIKGFLHIVDEVLVMTVKPGNYGGEFLPETLDKVNHLREISQEMDIEVDGGITLDTIKQAHDAGANMFVSGSFIMGSDNIGAAVTALKKEVETDGKVRQDKTT